MGSFDRVLQAAAKQYIEEMELADYSDATIWTARKEVRRFLAWLRAGQQPPMRDE